MKKLFLLFATVTLLVGFQACKQKEEAATEEVVIEETSSDSIPEPDMTKASAVDTDTSRLPKPPPDPKP